MSGLTRGGGVTSGKKGAMVQSEATAVPAWRNCDSEPFVPTCSAYTYNLAVGKRGNVWN